jgi:gamma-glutamyltranspeptidase/glutathione hydrolase
VVAVFFDSVVSRADDVLPIYKNGVVAADHPLASQAGVDTLKRGGNVVDAAVATGFALSVLRPGSAGIGGGGFMVIWDAKKKSATTLDYRERAPLLATRDMFTKSQKQGQGPPSSRYGAHAVAIPGHVAGLCYAQRKHGQLKLAEVLEPAIRYAREGVLLDEHELDVRKRIADQFKKDPNLQKKYVGLWDKYLLRGKLDNKTLFYSPQRRALEEIAEGGPQAFYHGEIAGSIVRYLAENGGRATLLDFRSMDVVTRKPVTMEINGQQIFCMPPPSSGGVALVETLQTVAKFEASAKRPLQHNSPDYVHVFTEALKHSFADRAAYLGDTDFSKVPIRRLLSQTNAQELADRINLKQTQPLKSYGRFLPVDDSGTSHFSVMDSAGNAVACTETVNTSFGSWMVDPKYGVVLNNEMDDFAARPGEPNAFGLIQSEANCVEPGKKPLSSMTPTIIVENGKAIHALGGSGGPRIISNTLQVLVNLTRFKMPVDQAVRQPRFHHQWVPDKLYMEPALFKIRSQALQDRGHTVATRKSLAVVQAVSRTKNGLTGFSDPRKHGKAAGY